MGAIDRTDLEWKTTTNEEFLKVAVTKKEIWCYPATDIAIPLDPEWLKDQIARWADYPKEWIKWALEGDRIYFWLPGF
jgi:hypothetical protein